MSHLLPHMLFHTVVVVALTHCVRSLVAATDLLNVPNEQSPLLEKVLSPHMLLVLFPIIGKPLFVYMRINAFPSNARSFLFDVVPSPVVVMFLLTLLHLLVFQCT